MGGEQSKNMHLLSGFTKQVQKYVATIHKANDHLYKTKRSDTKQRKSVQQQRTLEQQRNENQTNRQSMHLMVNLSRVGPVTSRLNMPEAEGQHGVRSIAPR